MTLDHGPGHTMTCVSRFWLASPVDRAAFTAAVAAVAAANPLLAARRRGREWLPVAFDPDRQIDWSDAGTTVEMPHLEPDDTLVRWSVRGGRLDHLGCPDADRPEDRGSMVVIRYPHAVADGLAATAAMRRVCDLLAGAATTLPTRADLAARLTLHHPLAAARRRTRWELGRIAKFFRGSPAPFAPEPRSPAAPGLAPIVCTRVAASRTRTDALRSAARACGVTVNDLLLAALFRVLARDMRPGATIRIAVPTSLRPEGNAAFCNQVSMVFLDRRADRTGDPGLLGGISAEMRHVKRWRLGHAMHSSLAVLCAPGDGPLKWIMGLAPAGATAVLSNLGQPLPDPAAAGGPAIVAHDLLPPLRPGTSVVISAVLHDGRLGLTLRYDPDRVSAARAHDLVARIVDEASALVGLTPDHDRAPPGHAAAERGPVADARSTALS